MGISNMAMRDAFFEGLYDICMQDRRIILLSDDLGAPSLDKFRRDLGSQYFNVGIAEQSMVSIAAGLSLGGKIVYMYGIAPFVTLRCLEQIKVDICCMNLPVTCLGVGAGYAYENAGATHHALEDISVMNALPGMTIYSPSDNIMAKALAGLTYQDPGPKYVRFDREKFPNIHSSRDNFSAGLEVLKKGSDLTIIATGIMTHQAFKVTDALAGYNINAGIIDLYRIKPLNEKLLMNIIGKTKRVVTLEEHFINGGIGSIVSDLVTDSGRDIKIKRIGIPGRYFSPGGGREELQRLSGLDVESIVKTILAWPKTGLGTSGSGR